MRALVPQLLNLILWLSFCVMAGTGLLLAFRLPPGSRGGRGLQAMGLGRHDWAEIHTWVSYVFIVGIILHLILHWRWLWQVACRRRAWPMLAGIGLGLALLFYLFLQPVHSRHAEKQGRPPQPNIQPS
ncbi:MAG: hypothetical protein OHK005_02480 [Candidatus Methylacidiphilales bacterium]